MKTNPIGGIGNTGEFSTKDYRLEVCSLQEHGFKPFIERIEDIILRSELNCKSQTEITFNELDLTDESERTALQNQKSQHLGLLIDKGIISPDEARQSVIKDENSGLGWLPEDTPQDLLTNEQEQELTALMDKGGSNGPKGGLGQAKASEQGKAEDRAFSEEDVNRDEQGRFATQSGNKASETRKAAETSKTESNKTNERAENKDNSKEQPLSKEGKKDYNINKKAPSFNEYSQQFKDLSIATPKAVIQSMGSLRDYKGNLLSTQQIQSKIEETDKKAKQARPSINDYRLSGKRETAVYTPERQEEHDRIIDELFEGIENKVSDNPTLILLGGRGGSGKSKFNGEVYDANKYVVLDSDEIKKKLKGYEGWNAAAFHEESSDILDKALKRAKKLKVNVVLDATMNGNSTTKRRLKMFADSGYRTEAHYMFLPPHKAAQRAVSRFLGEENGRYVPLDVILGMTENEKNFDEVKELVDSWSFSDNNVPNGEMPKLIAQKGELSLQGGGLKWMKKQENGK